VPLVVCLGAMALLGKVDVSLTAQPPLPMANLLKNPGLEQMRDGVPEAWHWSTAVPDNFEQGVTSDGRGGGHCLHIKAKSGVMSGYWSQTITVVPGKRYLFVGWYRLRGGKLLAYVHARTRKTQLDQRFYAASLATIPLVPVFLKPEYVGGARPDHWYRMRVPFTPPEGMKAVTVSVGMYFTPGEVWYDDLSVIEAVTTLALDVRADKDLRRVTLLRQGQQKPVWDSGELAAGVRHVARTVQAAADGVYLLRAEARDGEVAEARCPGGDE